MFNSIHKFKKGDDYFIIDPASGSVHLTDELSYNLLDKIGEPPFNAPENLTNEEKSVYNEILDLYEDGLLFAEDDFCEYAEINPAETPFKALCLHVAHDCNLRCSYCFAETGSYGGACDDVQDALKIMPFEIAKQSIDFLIANSGDREFLEADFFGGEPLMAWETVTSTVNYARKREKETGKKFRFTITTNGILLDDEKIDFINREMSNCVLSLDGRKEINDLARPTVNGKGSYELIVPKFQKLVKERVKPDFTDYYVRGTFTANNLDFSEDVKEMARLGFKNVSIEPVTVSKEAGNATYALKKEHIPRILEEYDKLYELIKSGELNVNFFHFNIDLNNSPCVIRRLRGCGSGNEYAAVAPNGDVYPCHRFVGLPEWKMGNVADISKTPLSASIRDTFAKTHVYSKSGCAECWARFYCSGGCAALSYSCYGDVSKTFPDSAECVMMKKRLENALALSGGR